MKEKTTISIFVLGLALCAQLKSDSQPIYKNAAYSCEERANDLLSRMTLEEKAAELNLVHFDAKERAKMFEYWVAGQRAGAFLYVRSVKDARALQEMQMKTSRLGIPLAFHEDAVRGYRTIGPMGLAESCTWDEKQVERFARAAATEGAADGVNLFYSPMADISCDSRWGRIMETSGEDAYLASRMVAARVRGFQGEGLERCDTVGACVKHFLGYASLEAGTDYRGAEFSKRDLFEIYIKPYEAAIEAGVASVMSSYLFYDGTLIGYNPYIGREVLRGYLGFKGPYLSDWTVLQHGIEMGSAKDDSEATIRGMQGGIDIDMVSGKYQSCLPRLIREGRVKESDVDDAVRRSLVLKFRLGLFDDPFLYLDEKRSETILGNQEIRTAAADLATESMVLLKNDGHALPLSTNKAIAITGELADDASNQRGTWDCLGRDDETITVRQGLTALWGDNISDDAETVVAVIGEKRSWSGEGVNRASLEIPSEHIELLKSLKTKGKKVIAIVLAGRPVIMQEILAASDAVLYAWMPGTMGGEAVARLVSGRDTPSGKTTITFPRHAGQIPVSYNRRRTFTVTGYTDMEDSPLFPFGYGLSYTTFAYSSPRLSQTNIAPGESVTVEVVVRNTGNVEGREIAQLYIRDEIASTIPRERELRGYKSVVLKPGEAKTLRFTLSPKDFEVISSDWKRVVEPGDVTIFVGGDSSTTNAVQLVIKENQ